MPVTKLLMYLVIFGAIGAGGYVLLNKEDILDFTPAKSPKEAADQFSKAMKARKYKMAAKYCTKPYAQELVKVADEAKQLGEAVTNILYQMQERGVKTDELTAFLMTLDPFPVDFDTTVVESGSIVGIKIDIKNAKFDGKSTASGTDWNMDLGIRAALHWYLVHDKLTIVAPIVRDGEHFKIDFASSEALQKAVSRLKEKGKDYANPLEVLSRELKRDAATKEKFKEELKKMMDEASK